MVPGAILYAEVNDWKLLCMPELFSNALARLRTSPTRCATVVSKLRELAGGLASPGSAAIAHELSTASTKMTSPGRKKQIEPTDKSYIRAPEMRTEIMRFNHVFRGNLLPPTGV
jgi:hypothetical protein